MRLLDSQRTLELDNLTTSMLDPTLSPSQEIIALYHTTISHPYRHLPNPSIRIQTTQSDLESFCTPASSSVGGFSYQSCDQQTKSTTMAGRDGCDMLSSIPSCGHGPSNLRRHHQSWSYLYSQDRGRQIPRKSFPEPLRSSRARASIHIGCRHHLES